ncbi:uncharacterized protein LOC113560350 [Rhopalosiphum maidis]|uniref:uncharacterized protein LOC113560350 n=1 Tax=Rhopalosiphum maidis TaxID=43146 RepID=UPI000F00A8DA|nr:uncharacterized protein LOC113560350 [Rhopalosiphum maidis]
MTDLVIIYSQAYTIWSIQNSSTSKKSTGLNSCNLKKKPRNTIIIPCLRNNSFETMKPIWYTRQNLRVPLIMLLEIPRAFFNNVLLIAFICLFAKMCSLYLLLGYVQRCARIACLAVI